MKRLAIVAATAASATLLVAAPASADPGICIEYDINGQAGTQCLPPADGGGLPGLPGLPELPGLPF